MEQNYNLLPLTTELALNMIIRVIGCCLYWSFIITCKGLYVPFRKQATNIFLTSLDVIKPFSREDLEILRCHMAPTSWGPPQCIGLQSEIRGIIIKALYMKWMHSFINSLKNKDLLLSTSLVFKGVRINDALPGDLSKIRELNYLCFDNCTGGNINLGMLLYRCSKLENLHLISNSFDISLCISSMQPNQEIKQSRLDVLEKLQSYMDNPTTLCSLSIKDYASTTKIDTDVNDEFCYDLFITSFEEITGGQFTAKLYCRFHLRGENSSARIVHIKVTGSRYQNLLGLPLGRRLLQFFSPM